MPSTSLSPADFVPLSWGQVGPYLAKAACDVALISTFGPNILQRFEVWADEVVPG